MYTLTAADFADTGQWQLIIKMSPEGLEADLRNTLHPEIPLQNLCSLRWNTKDSSVKDNIESAVYENPRLLDDFATKIVMYDPMTLFIPSDVLESHGAEAEIYGKVYPSESEDVMYDRFGDMTAAWKLAPGVRNFLLRTFPGARLANNLMEKVKTLSTRKEGVLLHISTRVDSSDFILTDDGKLIAACTKPIFLKEDIDATVRMMTEAYGYRPEDIRIETERDS